MPVATCITTLVFYLLWKMYITPQAIDLVVFSLVGEDKKVQLTPGIQVLKIKLLFDVYLLTTWLAYLVKGWMNFFKGNNGIKTGQGFA